MEQLVTFLFKVFFLADVVLGAVIVDTWQGTEDPIVLTTQGLVRGIKSTEGDFSSFMGIPYAQVNANNPFGSAEPVQMSEEVFEAHNDQLACPQLANPNWSKTMDCLRLNIYVPNEANSSNLLPVLVWIPGGGFVLGMPGEYSPWHLMKQGIVLVTVSYRLGAYGFMCLNTTTVPGNAGLKDQLAALRWVKQNIAAFGGNPDQVTLAGQSAGSSSVNLHLYASHVNEELFHQVILQSGTPIPLFTANDEQAAINMAGHLGFNAQDTDSAIAFLATLPTETVLLASEQLGYYFLPCIEKTVGPDSLVTTNPLWATFTNKSIPVMIGVTSMEALGLGRFNVFSNSFKGGIADLFDFSEEKLDKLTNIVQRFYAGDETDSTALVLKREEFDTDLVYNYPMEREITKMMQQGVGPVYSYVFEYVSENDAGDRETMRAPHTLELKYLFSFGQPRNAIFNAEEQDISDRICTYWGNFIKGGNPTPTSSDLMTWPTVSGEERPYMNIAIQPSIKSSFEHPNVAFWELFYGTYGANDRAAQF